MKTTKKDFIEKAERLHKVIEERKRLDKEEKELKDWAKLQATDGVLEAGSVVITLETKKRSSLDVDALKIEYSAEAIEAFMRESEYQMVNVTRRAA